MSGEKKSDPAVELLYANIGHLPDPDLGSISLMPFSQDSEQINALKKKVCAAIVGVFRDAGYTMDVKSKPVVSRDVRVNCRSCGTTLLQARTDESGVANVVAPAIIGTLSKMDSACPHPVVTMDDHRRRIEESLLAARGGGQENGH